MAYRILGSHRSPFVRIVRLFMFANDIPFDFDVVNYLYVKEDEARLAKESPINKIPIMFDDGIKIFDSRVMVNHLIKKHKLSSLSIDEENIVSVAYSAIETGVNLFLLKRDGLDLGLGVVQNSWFIQRQTNRIRTDLEFVTTWARRLDPSNPKDWNYASISLFSGLFWLNAVGMSKLSDYPELETFVEKFRFAKGAEETNFQNVKT